MHPSCDGGVSLDALREPFLAESIGAVMGVLGGRGGCQRVVVGLSVATG